MYFISRMQSSEELGGMPFMHSHEDYELYFLLSGKKRYFTSHTYCSFEQNVLIATAPFVLHKFEGGPYDRILVSINPSHLSPSQVNFLNMLTKNDIVSFSEKSMAGLTKILLRMLRVFDSPVQNGEMQFFLLLGQLFAYIYKYGKKTQQTLAIEQAPDSMAATPIILKVIDYINLHYTEKISLDELSNTYGISKTWLIKCFYQTTKKTIINYKITLQINAAKKLLYTTSKSLDAIAKECGFSSTNYFRIMFKRYVHVSPNKYRKHTVSVR